MARPREFNETAVAEATSNRESAEVMGLSTAILYNAHGDERALTWSTAWCAPPTKF
ncbi:MAG TPA: hypothetical protein VG227_06455 [Caulobacteraceae bacterium]|nr:hypothetical protein [Caulobacteraceae bacterium]